MNDKELIKISLEIVKRIEIMFLNDMKLEGEKTTNEQKADVVGKCIRKFHEQK